jgi:AcrR family transcriptional regulator
VAARQARTRAEIISTARSLLAHGPLSEFSLDRVADTLGVTKPAIYHYFANRAALMREAVAEGFLEHGRVLLAAARQAGDGPAVLSAATRAFVEHYQDRLEYFRLDFAWSQIHGNAQACRERILPVMNELTQTIAEKLRRKSGMTSMRARQLAVLSWCSAIGLLSALSMTRANGTDLAHPTETLLALLQGMLGAAAR